MAKKNTVLNNLPEEEILWADTKRWLGLPWTFTKYRADHDRLYRKDGFLKTETDETLLYRIHPWQAQPTRIECDLRIGQPHFLIEDHRHQHHGSIGQRLAQVEARYPEQRFGRLHRLIHFLWQRYEINTRQTISRREK